MSQESGGNSDKHKHIALAVNREPDLHTRLIVCVSIIFWGQILHYLIDLK